jgi:hypothetical protein
VTRSRAAAISLSAACLVPLVWPGDAPFINDEPLLIAGAMKANAAHTLAPMGLMGTFGFSYGPLPIWVYQPLVAITHNLVLVAALHTLVMVTATAGALWWLSRTLGLWVWFAPVPLLSPYFWFYSRALWDNPLLIPLGALAIAAYCAHLSSGSVAGLRVSLGALVAVLLVHLMGLALVIPVATHMLVTRWRALWADRFGVVAVAILSMAAWPYWRYLLSAHSPAQAAAARADGFFFPLDGARLLSARHLEYFFGPAPVGVPVIQAAAAASAIAYVLVWSGIGVAAWRIVCAIRAGQWSARDHVSILVLGMLACQSLIDGFSGRFQHPHYQNATWIATVLLAWMAVDRLASVRAPVRMLAPAASGVLAVALLLAVGALALSLHRTGGTRETYGPTLANQQRMARALAEVSADSRVSSSVDLYALYPHTLAVLRQLNPPRRWAPVRDVELRYVSADEASGRIELVER